MHDFPQLWGLMAAPVPDTPWATHQAVSNQCLWPETPICGRLIFAFVFEKMDRGRGLCSLMFDFPNVIDYWSMGADDLRFTKIKINQYRFDLLGQTCPKAMSYCALV